LPQKYNTWVSRKTRFMPALKTYEKEVLAALFDLFLRQTSITVFPQKNGFSFFFLLVFSPKYVPRKIFSKSRFKGCPKVIGNPGSQCSFKLYPNVQKNFNQISKFRELECH